MNLKKTRFTRRLIEVNSLDPDDFQSWAFCPGMHFNSPDKWWGDLGRRDFPHEGLDFCLYKNRERQVCRLAAGTRIPVMHDGVVRALFNDYLGQAVIIEHAGFQDGTQTYMSVYAHTRPAEGIEPGRKVAAGDVIAAIADTRRSKADILPHLHFTLGRPSADFIYEPFEWNIMRDPGMVVLCNPMELLDWPHQVVEVTP